jgi:hypothetical protein
MAGIKDSTTLELRADMKAPTVSVLGTGRKDRAETSMATDFTVVRLSVGLQSRTPRRARIQAPLEGTTMGARHAATRIEDPRACTAGAFMEVGAVE